MLWKVFQQALLLLSTTNSLLIIIKFNICSTYNSINNNNVVFLKVCHKVKKSDDDKKEISGQVVKPTGLATGGTSTLHKITYRAMLNKLFTDTLNRSLDEVVSDWSD